MSVFRGRLSRSYLPSKQDNVLGGSQRPGQILDFDHTVRAISSRINLLSETEETPSRIDHDNASVASHAVFGPYGIHLFTALEGNRQIAISDTLTDSEIFRFDVGRAPQGLALSADGQRLAVHNFMSRTVEVIDISGVVESGGLEVTSLGTTSTVAAEALAPDVLLGKQHFYDSKDDRLAGLAREGRIRHLSIAIRIHSSARAPHLLSPGGRGELVRCRF